MQPINLKAIARDAALRGDNKTLFHTLDLLEQLMPIATFMDFCTELDELRLQGEPQRRFIRLASFAGVSLDLGRRDGMAA